MATWCLPDYAADEFLKKLKSGEINPDKLSQMTSAQRRAFFSKIVGDSNARNVNALFERKLLLKNQQQGLITWAKQISGLKTSVKRDMVSKIERMTDILTPENEGAFLEDLAAQKLGVSVTLEEAGKIAELAKVTSERKVAIDRKSPSGSPSRMSYGRSLVAFGKYVSDLKNEANRIDLETFKASPGKTLMRMLGETGGVTKSMRAALDNSVVLRQGVKMLFTDTKLWKKNATQTYKDFWKGMKREDAIAETMAEVLSRENALNGLYKKERLAIGVAEEQFPTSLPEKIPGLGRLFSGSEAAFTGFQYRSRADVFDKYVEIAELTGADIMGVGKVANSLTGRGTFGQRAEAMASGTNVLFFSARFFKSNIDLLTAHMFDTDIGSFARKQAGKNLFKTVAGMAAILAIADQIWPGSVEWNPLSANFGKIKIGTTRFDVTGGMAPIVTLAARLLTGHSKSSVTGIVRKLNSGEYGSQTTWDVLMNFFQNKLSPVAGVGRDWLRGETFQGEKPNVLTAARDLTAPLPATNVYEFLSDPESAPLLAGLILDTHGVSTNTYGGTPEEYVRAMRSINNEVNRLERIGDKDRAYLLKVRSFEIIKKGKALETIQKKIDALKTRIKNTEQDVRLDKETKRDKIKQYRDKVKINEEKANKKLQLINKGE